MVPVPEDRVHEVYRLLANQPTSEAASGSSVVRTAEPPAAPDEALIVRAYRESPDAMRRFIEYLAEHPGIEVSSRQVAKDLGMTWNQLAGTLGAFGRRWKNRYRAERKGFFEDRWNFEESHQQYRMPTDVAAVIKGARDRG
jgi:hypothetical protein